MIEHTNSDEDLRPEYLEELNSTIIAAMSKCKDNHDTHHDPSIVFQMAQEIADMDNTADKIMNIDLSKVQTCYGYRNV